MSYTFFSLGKSFLNISNEKLAQYAEEMLPMSCIMTLICSYLYWDWFMRQRVFDLPRHREAASLALKHSVFSSYLLGPTWSTSGSPFKRMLVSLSPFYKHNSDDEITCPKPDSRLIAKIKWRLYAPWQTNASSSRPQIAKTDQTGIFNLRGRKNKVKYYNCGGWKTFPMDKTESDPCMKFCWHYIHNTFEKKKQETCQSSALLCTHVGSFICGVQALLARSEIISSLQADK